MADVTFFTGPAGDNILTREAENLFKDFRFFFGSADEVVSKLATLILSSSGFCLLRLR